MMIGRAGSLKDTIKRLEATLASLHKVRETLLSSHSGAARNLLSELDERVIYNAERIKSLNRGLEFLRRELQELENNASVPRAQ
jgi:hypothetical protein